MPSRTPWLSALVPAALVACAGHSVSTSPADRAPPAATAASALVVASAAASASTSAAAESDDDGSLDVPTIQLLWSQDGRFLVTARTESVDTIVVVRETNGFAPVARFKGEYMSVGLTGQSLLMKQDKRLESVRLGEPSATTISTEQSSGELTSIGLVDLREGCAGGNGDTSLCVLRPPSPRWAVVRKTPLCPPHKPIPRAIAVGASSATSLLLDLDCHHPAIKAWGGARGNDPSGTSVPTIVLTSPLRAVTMPRLRYWAGADFAGFSPDGKRLVMVNQPAHDAMLFDAHTGRLLREVPLTPWQNAPLGVSCLTVNDRQAVVIGDGGIHVFSTTTGATIARIDAGPDWDSFSLDGCDVRVRDSTLFVTDSSGVQRRSLPSLEPLPPLPLPGPRDHHLDASGRHAISHADVGHRVYVTDLDTQTSRTIEARGWVSLDPQGRWLVIGDTVWSLATGQQVAKLTP